MQDEYITNIVRYLTDCIHDGKPCSLGIATPSSEWASHRHTYWEIKLRGRTKRDGIEQIILVPPGICHSADRPKTTGVNINLQINARARLGYTGGFICNNPLRLKQLDIILKHLDLLVQLREYFGDKAQPVLNSHAFPLIRELLAFNVPLSNDDTTPPKGNSFQLAVRYIEANCTHPSLSIAEVAGFLNIKTTNLGRLFRTHVDISAARFLIIVRLRKACTIMSEIEQPIEVTARQSGWRNPKHFATVFRRFTGMTPSKYIVQCRTGNPKMPAALEVFKEEQVEDL